MPDWLKRAAQALAVWALVLAALAIVWRPALSLPELWMLLAVGVAANVMQPSYKLGEGSRTQEDRGTAVQILYSVYLVQIAALVELCFRKPQLELDVVSLAAFALMAFGLFLRSWAVLELGRFFTWNVEV